MFSIRLISYLVLLFFVLSFISAVPVQLHEEPVEFNEIFASPELIRALARSYATLVQVQKMKDPANVIDLRNLDQIGGGNLLRSLKQRQAFIHQHNLDSIQGGTKVQSSGDSTHAIRPQQSGRLLSSVTFGDNRNFDFHIRKPKWANNINGMDIYEGSIKRNIDEIDRSGFDNFVKRNFDEIDRSGWDSFVKRRVMNTYLAGRPH